MATAMMAATAIVHLVAVGVFGRLPRHMAGEWGFQIADLAGRHWWNVLTTLFLSSSTASMLLGMAVLALVLGLAEFTVGTLRAAGLFLTTQLAAVVLYAGMVALGTLTGIDLPAGMAQATLLVLLTGLIDWSSGTEVSMSTCSSAAVRRKPSSSSGFVRT